MATLPKVTQSVTKHTDIWDGTRRNKTQATRNAELSLCYDVTLSRLENKARAERDELVALVGGSESEITFRVVLGGPGDRN
jgi:hypothetical protein